MTLLPELHDHQTAGAPPPRISTGNLTPPTESCDLEFLDGVVGALSEQLARANGQTFEASEAYVACFSLHEDALSQWRAYAPQAGGFALCFDPTKVWAEKVRNPLSERLWLLPCEYEPRRVMTLGHQLVGKALEIAAREFAGRVSAAVEAFLQHTGWATCAVKHAGFSEESEWRIVRFGTFDQIEDLELNSKPTLTPFTSLDFGSPVGLLACVSKVIVGPQRHNQMAAAALRAFVKRTYGVALNVELSRIPFRVL